MAKKKQKRRNAASGGGRARAMVGRARKSQAFTNIALALGGGAVGAVAAGAAVGAGVKPQTAALVTLGAGALGAYALKGPAKVAAVGAAAMASGQIALAWQVKRQAEQAAKKDAEQKKLPESTMSPSQIAQAPQAQTAPGNTPKRNAASGYDDDDDEHDGYDDVRNAGELDDYADDYDDAA